MTTSTPRRRSAAIAAAESSFTGSADGQHTGRLAVDGRQHGRLALLGQLRGVVVERSRVDARVSEQRGVAD
jgi:hypothetical protein